MAAPSGITWSGIQNGNHRLGIYVNISDTGTNSNVSIEVWLWTKYELTDSTNRYYFNNNATSATTLSKSDISLSHTATSTWATANQTKLATHTYTYTKSSASKTVNCAAKIDSVGTNKSTVSFSTSYTIPALSTYTISFDANGGTGAPLSQTKIQGTSITLSSTKPTRTGYTFLGWNTSSASTSAKYSAGETYTEDANKTLYAVWKVNTYTVSFDANGGTGAPSKQTKTHGVPLTLTSSEPTRTNYNFLGWSISPVATTPMYTSGGTYEDNISVGLYAVWQLAYTAPRITDVEVYRSDSSGAEADEGTYIHVSFNWATDKAVTSPITIYVKKTSASTWSSATSTVSGTSGSINRNIGGSYSTEDSYDVKIEVTDSSGSSTITRLVPSTKYMIDFLHGGDGVAIGKPAKTANLLDIFWNTSIDGTLKVNGIKVEGDKLTPPTINNPISSIEDDTPTNWKPYRHSFQYFNTNGVITDQPSQYGTLLNFGNSGAYVRQMWFELANGSIHHRGGNSNNAGWTGTWKELLDSSNYSEYALPLDKYGVISSSGEDPDTTMEHLIYTNVNTPNGGYMYIKTDFGGTKTTTVRRMQTAFPYSSGGAIAYFRLYANGVWDNWIPFGHAIMPGDTYTVPQSSQISGIISDSMKVVLGTLYLGTPIVANSITLSGSYVVRGVKGYLNSMDYNVGVAVNSSGYECSATIVDAARGVINIRLKRTEGYTNATNNTPISIASPGDSTLLLKLKFN